MRVYLACTIRGDRSRLAVARAVGAALEEAGHELLTGRFLDEKAEDEDGRLTAQEVFLRDLRWLDQCDVLVAEASGSSFGVGFEVGYLAGRADPGTSGPGRRPRVIVLYDATADDRISRMVSGNVHPACLTIAYRDQADAVRRVLSAMA